MKRKRLYGILLGLALMIGMIPALSQTAYADVTEWSVGGSINLNGKYVFESERSASSGLCSDYSTNVPQSQYSSSHGEWKFENIAQKSNGTFVSIYIEPPEGKTSEDTPVGFKVAGGSGTGTDGYVFELVYPVEYPLWVGGTQVTSVNLSGVGWSYTPAAAGENPVPARLTLEGYSYEGEGYGNAAIYAEEELTIEIKGDNAVKSTVGSSGCGVAIATDSETESENKLNLTICGSGQLTAAGDHDGIYARDDITVEGGTVTASGKEQGIESDIGKVTIKGGNTDASSSDDQGAGICAFHDITINGGTVSAAAAGNSSAGIRSSDGSTNIDGGTVDAAGVQMALDGKVKNSVIGIGYTDKEGTQGKGVIGTDADGRELPDYKNIHFPGTAAKVTTAPTARALTANGSPQELVTAGKASGGQMQYALGKDGAAVPAGGWSTSIPKGTNAGDYYVWYKAAGDSTHYDSDAACVKVTVAKAQAPVGSVHNIGGSDYVVTSADTVSLVKAVSKKSFTLPAAVTISGKAFNVTGINAKAFKGKKVKTLTVKTRKLTKKSVKGSLKGSKVKTVKVKVGKKKENKKYVKKYKKIFTRKNAGKKVRMK